ncbi:hypothetical protein GCM10025875_02470 [Litorihabitans aurantiacus]|uniref:Polyphosphate kinase C-terminal domain-containing protein n=1 Tax=Litorihabitans aurantiacus TaxID=1930061 RepID=A0AA37XCU2_9MICO|nr:hypothetical protein GCM10025875_02470 [Litorihabitans aurantiacus]
MPVGVVVRGICAIRAGVPGLSENIRVRSILGRFLEHSRVYAFGNGGEPEYFIGSADLMHRNLDRRVEVLVRLVDPDHVATLARLFEASLADTTASWHLRDEEGEQRWVRVATSEDGEPLLDLQASLMPRSRQRARVRRSGLR